MTFGEQMSFDLLDAFPTASGREYAHAAPAASPQSAPARRARKAPLVRCQCGRRHRTWNPHKVCNRCVTEERRGVGVKVSERVRELELERVARHASPETAAMFAAIHARWLARQSLDHPWRVAAGGGEA